METSNGTQKQLVAEGNTALLLLAGQSTHHFIYLGGSGNRVCGPCTTWLGGLRAGQSIRGPCLQLGRLLVWVLRSLYSTLGWGGFLRHPQNVLSLVVPMKIETHDTEGVYTLLE